MVDNVVKYATALGAREEVVWWVRTVMAAALRKRASLDQGEMEHVVDFLISEAAPKRLRRVSVKTALEQAEAWSRAQQKKGRALTEDSTDTELIHDFLDGSRIVRLLTKKAYQREGFLMSHCVGGYDPERTTVYSYRDAKNLPHATFEVTRDGREITQIKGKGNGAIHPKYIHPILAFLKAIGTEVRPDDMSNLGYLHVPDAVIPLFSLFTGSKGEAPPTQVLYGNHYMFVG